MSDLKALAHQFVVNAVALQPGEKIEIIYEGNESKPLADACAAAAVEIGAASFEESRGADFYNVLAAASAEDLEHIGQADFKRIQGTHAYLRICDIGDEAQITASLEEQARVNAALIEARNYRVSNTRWLVVSAPTRAFADACSMEYSKFQSFYSAACLFDYTKMYKPAEALGRLMAEAKQVEIKGKGTDLKFSIDGIGSKECIGKRNIPDGEVYTAPVKGSVEGTVLFGPSVYMGQRFDEIFLRYAEGRVVDAKGANDVQTASLNRILDLDEGARYPGEWAMAFNPMISEPVGDILFDEKIRESWHFANGQAYKGKTDNGNTSKIHWDKVQIQRPDHGGGEIWMDGRLVRKDGLFVVPELEALNPDRLCPSV